MPWVEIEARRANRNLLVFNLILGVASGYGIFAILNTMLRNWSERGSDGWWVPMIPAVALLALALWNCMKAIQRYWEIEETKVWRHLSVFGQPRQLSSEIEQDLHRSNAKYGGLKITSHWLIRRNVFSTWISPIADVAWAYKGITRHRTNGIPTGKTYSVAILGRHKQKITVRASEKKVDALLAEIMQRVPWAVFGYGPELVTTWNKNHAGFVAAVDERRQRLIQK
jgi:hypothetical protein